MKNWKKFYWLLIVLIAAILLLFITFDKNIYFISSGKAVLSKDGHLMSLFISKDDQYVMPFSFYKDYPEKFKECVLIKEDKRFYYHPGFDPISIIRAFIGNISGQKRSGASTITMQLARMRSLRKRTYFNKMKEIFEAILIELTNSKKQILKAYLDQAPYGMNIRGVGTAANLFFLKDIDELSWAEYATLAVLPNNPSYVNFVVQRDRLRIKRDELLKKLLDEKMISLPIYKLSIAEKIPEFKKNIPFYAPHLCMSLKDKRSSYVIHTTIDMDIQKQLETITKEELRALKKHGINNLSVIVIKNSSREIIGYIGNPLFFDLPNDSMVDGVRASRSTGSILKPFLYALAIDEGMILPESILFDIPTFYGPYSPENFDGTFQGVVRVKDALIRSLNVPAVRLLQSYSVNAFYYFLKQAGMTTLFRDADDYGLSLIIGGAEGNLREISEMFCSLANGGEFTRSKILFDEKSYPKKSLISNGASTLILDCLKDLSRPGIDRIYAQLGYSNQISWKTGTSYGAKDAWAVGSDGEYTVGVWSGNFNGDSSPDLTGSRASAPVLFRIFALFKEKENGFKDKDHSKEFSEIVLCEKTGYRAGPGCEKTITSKRPADAKLLKSCPYHVRLPYNKEKNEIVCSSCWQGFDYNLKSFLYFPPEIQPYLSENYKKDLIPKHNPLCPEIDHKKSIRINYPTDKAVLSLVKDEKIAIRISTNQKNTKYFLYFNSILLDKSIGQEVFYITPKKGKNIISVINEKGDTDKVIFFVR